MATRRTQPRHGPGARSYVATLSATVRLDLSHGSSVLTSGTGDDTTVLWQRTADGDVYSNFDDQGLPHHVVFADV